MYVWVCVSYALPSCTESAEESKQHSFTYSTTLGHFDGPVTGINRRGLSGQALVVLAGLDALSKARIMFRTLRVWATM